MLFAHSYPLVGRREDEPLTLLTGYEKGGSIAVGHPLGMTGARLQATMVNSLQHHDKQTGLITMCVGGGMGAAGLFEII